MSLGFVDLLKILLQLRPRREKNYQKGTSRLLIKGIYHLIYFIHYWIEWE